MFDFGYISKSGKRFLRKPGRPRTGEVRHCKGCGREMYLRRWQVEQRRGDYCKECNNKIACPPLKVKEGIYLRWGSLRNMLKGLVPKAENLTLDETFGLVAKVLEAQFKRDGAALIVELGYGDKTFTPEQIVTSAFELYIEVILESYPDRFEQTEDGRWRAKRNEKEVREAGMKVDQWSFCPVCKGRGCKSCHGSGKVLVKVDLEQIPPQDQRDYLKIKRGR